MIFMQSVVTALYYALAAGAALVIAHNFLKAKTWEREVLYLIVLVPFMLRILFLK
jgi:hypothetical protein